MDWRQHISVNPNVCHGQACFTGTRIMVSVVLDNLAAEASPEEILRSDPSLPREAIQAAIAYAADLARERTMAIPALMAPPSLFKVDATLRGGTMKTVILEVREPADVMADFVKSWKTGEAQESARISFATPELLWKVLTAKRWEILKALCGAGPVSIREVARRIGRDVKAVHGDIAALLSAGLLSRAEGGGVEFPYEAVKVEFVLKAA